MLPTKSKNLITISIITITHNILFWNQYMGINLLIFTLILTGVLYVFYKESFKSASVQLTLVGNLISGGLVVLYGSDFAKFIHCLSLTAFIGFVHAPELKSIMYALFTSLESVLTIHKSISENTKNDIQSQNSKSNTALYRKISLSLIPFLFLILFYLIYLGANEKFANLSFRFWNIFFTFLGDIFGDISFGRILFALIGIGIALIIVYKPSVIKIVLHEKSINEKLIRIKENFTKKYNSESQIEGSKDYSFDYGKTMYDPFSTQFKVLDLKNEYLSAVMMVAMINVLLLVVNGIDLNWIWINFDVKKVNNLSAFVHEGTYLLILSILLSMGIMEYFFRKNINFYSKNQTLKMLCYAWIVQNMFMVISVGIRNYHYIAQHGLAYKRIGVLFFLLLTIVGLFTQYVKISQTKSIYYLFRINSWATYFVLLLMTSFDWDVIIASHNVNHTQKDKIDEVFLLTLAPKTLPILYESEYYQSFNPKHKVKSYNPSYTQIENQIALFLTQYPKRTIFEWNYADYNAYQLLNKK